MLVKPMSFATYGPLRRFAAATALWAGLAVLLAIPASAQVNIDQGKSPAEIYASDCATCHKTPRGLAVGKNSLMLSSFLREHYTASSDQAAALAAYVLSAGGREPVAARPKPGTEHARAEEAKPGAHEIKPAEPKNRAVRAASANPEEPKPAKQEQAEREAHPATDSGATEEQEERSSPAAETTPAVAAPAADATPPAATMPTPAATAPTPAANAVPPVAVAEPQDNPQPPKAASSGVPNIELGSTTTAVPPAHQSSAGPTVPRDKIPD